MMRARSRSRLAGGFAAVLAGVMLAAPAQAAEQSDAPTASAETAVAVADEPPATVDEAPTPEEKAPAEEDGSADEQKADLVVDDGAEEGAEGASFPSGPSDDGMMWTFGAPCSTEECLDEPVDEPMDAPVDEVLDGPADDQEPADGAAEEPRTDDADGAATDDETIFTIEQAQPDEYATHAGEEAAAGGAVDVVATSPHAEAGSVWHHDGPAAAPRPAAVDAAVRLPRTGADATAVLVAVGLGFIVAGAGLRAVTVRRT